MTPGGCCATGPCPRSRARGGAGCYLCDVVARLPRDGRPPREAPALFAPPQPPPARDDDEW